MAAARRWVLSLPPPKGPGGSDGPDRPAVPGCAWPYRALAGHAHRLRRHRPPSRPDGLLSWALRTISSRRHRGQALGQRTGRPAPTTARPPRFAAQLLGRDGVHLMNHQLPRSSVKVEIDRLHKANFGVHGARKVWRQLRRESSTGSSVCSTSSSLPGSNGHGCPGSQRGRSRTGLSCSRRQCRAPQAAPSVRLIDGLGQHQGVATSAGSQPDFQPSTGVPTGTSKTH